MEENTIHKCTGDCLMCSAGQRQYCAAQFTFANMRMLESLQTAFAELNGNVKDLKAKMDAIQGNEATLFNPTAITVESAEQHQEEITAQEG